MKSQLQNPVIATSSIKYFVRASRIDYCTIEAVISYHAEGYHCALNPHFPCVPCDYQLSASFHFTFIRCVYISHFVCLFIRNQDHLHSTYYLHFYSRGSTDPLGLRQNRQRWRFFFGGTSSEIFHTLHDGGVKDNGEICIQLFPFILLSVTLTPF